MLPPRNPLRHEVTSSMRVVLPYALNLQLIIWVDSFEVASKGLLQRSDFSRLGP